MWFNLEYVEMACSYVAREGSVHTVKDFVGAKE